MVYIMMACQTLYVLQGCIQGGKGGEPAPLNSATIVILGRVNVITSDIL